MFLPDANRLCKFFELSAMTTYLATAGGVQGKQGYLRIMSSGASRKKTQSFDPLGFHRRHEPKWFVVRDSYLVATNNPDEVCGPNTSRISCADITTCADRHMGCFSF
jgi:phospholipase D1/2